MDLSTNYLGLRLRTPIVPSASPLSGNIDSIKKMEDAGASAIVMFSLFEEQLANEQQEIEHFQSQGSDCSPEATSFVPESLEFQFGPEQYLENLRKAKEAVDIPIIASLNGATPGGWTRFASWMEQAGADAIETNIYRISTDPDQPAEEIEREHEEIIRELKKTVNIPIALKIGAYFTNFAHAARRFDKAGASGLVLFNRFYQPDIDLDELEVVSSVLLSTPQAMRLPLRWIAILSGRVEADLAATGGIHSSRDVIKMLLVGASVTQVCSVLLKDGIDQIRHLELGLKDWLVENEYESLEQMQGSMCQKNVANPGAFERVQYMKALQSFSSTG